MAIVKKNWQIINALSGNSVDINKLLRLELHDAIVTDPLLITFYDHF